MSSSKIILNNGFTIIYTQRLHSPNVALSLRFIAGSLYESEDEVGVAHFLEHIVFDGTEKYPSAQQLANLIDGRGAVRNGLTSKETVEYIVKILKEDIEVAFEYLSQITMHPLLADKEIEKEKKVIEQEINRFKSDPGLFSSRLIYSLIFPGTRLGGLNTGDIEDVKKIEKADISSYLHRTHSAKNTVLSIVGDISLETIKRLAETYFGKMNMGNIITPLSFDTIPITEPHIEIMPHLKQTTLVVGYQGYKINTQEHYVLDIISYILSRGNSSRLVDEIREKRGLAYSVNVNNTSSKHAGIFSIKVGLSESNVDECLQIIKTEIRKICDQPIPPKELAKAFSYIKSNFTFSFEDSLDEASFYSQTWCSSGMPSSVDGELEQYAKIIQNPSLIQKVAREIFSKNPSILLLTPKERVVKW